MSWSIDLPHSRIARLEDERSLRTLAAAALVVLALPVAPSLDGGLFVWNLLATSHGLELCGLLAPIVLAAMLLAATLVTRVTRMTLGFAALVSLAVAAALFTGSRAATEQLFTLLFEYVTHHPLVVLGGLTLVGVGASMRNDEVLAPWARGLLIAGGALLALLYALPERGQPMALGIVATARAAVKASDGRAVMGGLLRVVLDIMPLLIAIAAWVQARPRAHSAHAVAALARFGLPGLGALTAIPLLFSGLEGTLVLTQIRAALLCGVAVGVASQGLEALLRHLLEHSLPPEGEAAVLARDVRLRQLLRAAPEGTSLLAAPGVPASHPLLAWLVRRRIGELAGVRMPANGTPLTPDPETARAWLARLDGTPPTPARETLALRVATGPWTLSLALGGAALVLLAGLAWRVHRPAPDLAWELGEKTATDEALFKDMLPDFLLALSERNRALRKGDGGAEAANALRTQSQEMLAAARELDAGLASTLGDLVKATDAVDLSGELWVDRVNALNRDVRRLGLPYYVEASFYEFPEVKNDRPTGRVRRVHLVFTYDVEAIRRFTVDGREYAALRVRRLDQLNVGAMRLGYVRWDEPFALIDVGAIEEHVSRRLDSLITTETCGASSFEMDDQASVVDAACGQAVLSLFAAAKRDVSDDATRRSLVERQIAATERHELQHQVDGEDLDVPAALYDVAPNVRESDLGRASKEMSAYLCELVTDDPVDAALLLVQLMEFAMSDSSVYHYAGALVLGNLGEGPVLKESGRVSLTDLETIAAWIEVQGTDLAARVSERASAAHERLFGTACPNISRE